MRPPTPDGGCGTKRRKGSPGQIVLFLADQSHLRAIVQLGTVEAYIDPNKDEFALMVSMTSAVSKASKQSIANIATNEPVKVQISRSWLLETPYKLDADMAS